MRISADCIDAEEDDNHNTKQTDQLSDHLSGMSLNEDIRVIYKAKNSTTDGFVSLSVIPLTKPYANTDGYLSHWHEVKQQTCNEWLCPSAQVLDLNFKNMAKVPKSAVFMARIESAGYEGLLTTEDDYLTALKVSPIPLIVALFSKRIVAELCGQPLDVMISNTVDDICVKSGNTSRDSDNKNKESKRSSIDSNGSAERNDFVLLDTNPADIEPKSRSDSSTQLDNNFVVMTKTQIESIKNEITIDVTKRLISKLTECLTEMTTESIANSVASGSSNTSSTATAAPDARPEPPRAEPMVETAKVVHRGIICDNCDLQVEGVRYKCINCLDFDLCEKCKQLPSVHDSSHAFNKIERYICGIPQQPIPNHLDFLKPFLSEATIDPNTRDVILALDVDLRNGTISTTNVPKTVPSNSTTTQTSGQNAESDNQTQGNGCTSTTNEGEGEASGVGPQVHLRKYVSEKKANKIAKKLEKLKFKSQMYNNLLQSSDERTTLSTYERIKQSPYGTHIQNPAVATNKKLYLSGLLVGDETIPEGTRVPPNTRFRKTWKVRNTGTKVWTGRTTLRYVWGHPELEPFGRVTEVQAPTLRPGEEGRVTIRFTSPNPSTPTRYQSHWRLHHRGQPFGQRLECKVIVDPSADPMTPLAPILSKDSKSTATHPLGAATTSKAAPKSSLNANGYYGLGATNCNLDSIANIHASILESQRHLSERLKAMAYAKQSALNTTNKEKTQKTSVKKLTEALTAVKEIRFDLDESEPIAMRCPVKSHTATPTNTPFDVSPPKSPEPTSASNSFTQLESPDKSDSNEPKDKSEDKRKEEEEEDKGEESDNESLDVLSLSSGESSDEFVLVPLPSCFDLNVPFSGVDNKAFEDIRDEDSLRNKDDDKCFEVIDENMAKNDETLDSDEDNTHLDGNAFMAENVDILDTNDQMTTPLDLTTDKHSNSEQSTPETEIKDSNASQTESEPQVRPKTLNASTNPFRNATPNETENVIHVLPESIVTGALSTAAHVYNSGANFAWVTSPPPAALPLPDMYWDRRPQQYSYYDPPGAPSAHMSAPNGPTVENTTSPVAPHMTASTPGSAYMTSPTAPVAAPVSPPEEAPTRLSSALRQLFEMGFWNQKLNEELLEKNGFDVNDTIEELLSPERGRRRGNGPTAGPQPVVSHQPRNTRNGFIEEFD
ncbi:unnamed protein product [Oppiella nova]|uniref:Next to BRCA1 gene 1 protein n=1 Tax=Oppiella nova TaxID=334625 RepID=A0A7R9QPZ5_9ACAR|nr:unnamed protein product [Oppiella nova]CAG2169536.1 unnamed protein product [Oppiella nova]